MVNPLRQSHAHAAKEERKRQRKQGRSSSQNLRPSTPVSFSHRVYEQASRNLFMLVPGLDKNISDYQINLATLQRMNLYAIQRDLVELVGDIVKKERMTTNSGPGSQAQQTRKLMSEYCNAWRDWEMIRTHASTVAHDPFRISCHDRSSQELFNDAGLLGHETIAQISALQKRKSKSNIDLEKGELELPGESRHAFYHEENFNRVIVRFLGSVAASLFLVVPVLIMVLHESSNLEALIVTAVSIVLFAFVVSLWLDKITQTDALAATLSYAAVLVVFTSLRVVPV